MSTITSVYDIYNATLAADQPTVDAICAAILVQLGTSVDNSIPTFNFDVTTYMVDISLIQQNRIIEGVLRTLRNEGIHIRVNNTPSSIQQNDSASNPYFTPFFNSMATQPSMLTVTWYERNSSEYMKTFC